MNLWAFVHHVIAHPLVGLLGGNFATGRFHDWTAAQAWPDATDQ
jgi:hypothetical protein